MEWTVPGDGADWMVLMLSIKPMQPAGAIMACMNGDAVFSGCLQEPSFTEVDQVRGGFALLVGPIS